MPTKQLPNVMSFAAFAHSLEKRGFRRLSKEELKNDCRRLALQAPSPRTGRETGFIFSANGLDAVVWTTFLEKEGFARNRDAGWVLIKDGDDVRYFSHPMHRTKNFLYRLLWNACIARQRVLNRPLCPECAARMRIAYGKGTKSRYWRCYNPKVHRKAVCLSWDHGLPQEALDYLKPVRKQREKYRAKLRKAGKIPWAALRGRIGWKVGRRRNVVRAR